MVNADDTESNNDRNAANRDRIQAEKAESADSYSVRLGQTRIDRRLKKTKLYSADSLKEELAQSASASADRTGDKQASGEMKAIGSAENISNQVRQARTNRQLKKTLLYSTDIVPNSNPTAPVPNTPPPSTPVPNTLFPTTPPPSTSVPNTLFPNTPPPTTSVPNTVQSEIESAKLQARPRQQARMEQPAGTRPVEFEREERGTSRRENRRESPQDFLPESPNKRNLVVPLVVSFLLLAVGTFVLTSSFHPKGNVHAGHKIRASKPAGPLYYTGMQVSFNPDQEEMTVENMQEYNSTKVSDEVGLYVASVLPNSPAGKVNIQLGARLVTIDGESINGLTIQEVQGMLEGESKSSVTVCVRSGIQPPKTFTLLRLVPVDSTAVGKGAK